MSTIAAVSLSILWSDLAQLERQGVTYGYGAKAEGSRDPRTGRRWNPNSTGHLDTPLSTIEYLDCSGYIRYALFRASAGKLILPDGSQMQRTWMEGKAAEGDTHSIHAYYDEVAHMTATRLFINFIKPGVHGCGPVGHVFLLALHAGKSYTLESYGGNGPGCRIWNAPPLSREWYSGFEIPTKP